MVWTPNKESRKYADSCGAGFGYYQRLPVSVAAALWCDIPEDEIERVLHEANEVGRAIFRHPFITCLEPKCRAIHEAIESGELPVFREQGGAVSDYVKPERRHVSRKDLKDWIARHWPDQRPPALFDDVERAVHPAISEAAFNALKADVERYKKEIEKAKNWRHQRIQEIEALKNERDHLRAQIDRLANVDKQADEELPHNAKRNYHRLILALASMADLSLDEHFAAAVTVLKEADLKGLPRPSKTETWARILERAKETD